jgi:GT2 family glycosyltransferase
MLPPADELLAPESAARLARERPDWRHPGWAVFDAAWYLARYPEAEVYCQGDVGAALGYYLELGVQLGHSPSPLFDEAFYLAENPDVAELVKIGKYRSGFDHYCQHGHRLLAPHWLFDDGFYARIHDDMSLENLDQHNFHGRYDHYLRAGQYEHRAGHYIFDAAFYRLRAIEAGMAAGLDERGPYAHFLYSLRPAGMEPRPSIYFEPNWYLEHAQGSKSAIARQDFGSALEHYLRNATPELFDPVPQFSEAYYRAAYRDVAHAIEVGTYRNGYQHFIQFGAYELRSPRPEIDLVYYRDANDRVRDDLRAGVVRDAFAHLRLIGLPQGLAHAAPGAVPLTTEPLAKELFIRRARDGLAFLARRKIDFSTAAPEVSVLMVLFNQFELTMQALASLRDNFAGGIELILIDNASSDDTRHIGDYVLGAKILRLAENAGFLRAANQGLSLATAAALLFLNNDVLLHHGALGAALARLGRDDKIGAVCGKIIRTHGALQEAGSIIWRDGSTAGYLRDAPALSPGANFVRDVDYGSAVFLLCRTALVQKLGGFDADFAPAYYEDSDLCVRLQEAGYRIVYDPAVAVTHLEHGSAENSESALAMMRRAQKVFQRKHKEFLQNKLDPDVEHPVFARAAGEPARKVLFIEDTVPLRQLGSGFVRANDIVCAIVKAGFEVSVLPINGAPYSIQSLLGGLPETVEILHDLSIDLLENFLHERRGFYDLIWISRTHNLARVRPKFEAAGVFADRVPIVLDTEAVVTVRDAAFAIIKGGAHKNFNFDAALQAEFAGTEICRHVTAVSALEVDLLNSLGLRSVSMIGTKRLPRLTEASFESRDGLLFVASIHQADSPNLDSLNWYAEEILPALAREMEQPPVLNFCGYVAPHIDLSAFGGEPRIKIHGPAADLTPFYASNRLFIAPTRFAAGTPYKIYEAAGYGLPCVTSDLLARQLGWTPGVELLMAPVYDARRFAAQIALLYRTASLWMKIRQQAAARLAAENSAAQFEESVTRVLEGVLGGSKKELLFLKKKQQKNF